MFPGDASRVRRATLSAAAVALVATGVLTALAGAPVAWFLLGVCAILPAGVLFVSLWERRFFEPLTIISVFVLASFVLRPLQVFLGHQDLASWRPPESTLEGLIPLEQQEISRYATEILEGALEPALTRGIAACALFTTLVLVGFFLPVGRRLGERLSGLGRSTTHLNLKAVVVACLVLGVSAQIGILARTGGIEAATESLANQRTLQAGFILYFLAGFAVAGLLIWAAWRRPRTRLEWIAFSVVLIELCLFYALTGSRKRVFVILLFLTVVSHYLWRPWRLRSVAAAALAFTLFATAVLAVRQATYGRSFSEAVAAAPRYAVDPHVFLNDITEFDQLFIATNFIPSEVGHKHGEWIVDAVHSYVPGFVDPSRPDGGDIVFRKAVWGESTGAGRPITLAGDLYFDFGWAGIAVGSLLFGMLARASLGLLRAGAGPGRQYRVALYAIVLLVLNELASTTYSVALGFVFTLGVPFLIAVHLFGRWPEHATRRTRPARLRATAKV